MDTFPNFCFRKIQLKIEMWKFILKDTPFYSYRLVRITLKPFFCEFFIENNMPPKPTTTTIAAARALAVLKFRLNFLCLASNCVKIINMLRWALLIRDITLEVWKHQFSCAKAVHTSFELLVYSNFQLHLGFNVFWYYEDLILAKSWFAL